MALEVSKNPSQVHLSGDEQVVQAFTAQRGTARPEGPLHRAGSARSDTRTCRRRERQTGHTLVTDVAGRRTTDQHRFQV
jgi:hypothetical protein